MELNCWEYMKCGREPEGKKADELGVCPAALDTESNGINGGKNAGRHCWAVAGTFCGGAPQGSFSRKISNCLECEFFGHLRDDLGEQFQFLGPGKQLDEFGYFMEELHRREETIRDLATPIIPLFDQIIAMPLVGVVDSVRAREIMRAMLAGIRDYRARVVILDVTGVPLVDSAVASHLHRTLQAARLKGVEPIVTGVSDAVAETIVDLGIDWSSVRTMCDLQTGLLAACDSLGYKLVRSARQA